MFGFLRRKKAPAQAPQAPGATDGDATADAANEINEAPQPTESNQYSATTGPNADRSTDASGPDTGAVSESPADTQTTDHDQPIRQGWMARLRSGLSKTRNNLSGLFGGTRIDDALYEELETALLSCDAGVAATDSLLTTLRERVRSEGLQEPEQVRDALCDALTEMLTPLEAPMDIDRASPLVMMIVGVNGAGKTTSIGKLAKHLQSAGKSVLLAAGDTFRAAAREQLAEWGKRNNVQVVAQDGADPAAVAFDAVSAGQARGTGVVIVDTAGRLPTQANLMQELAKIHRVIGKAMPEAPHESLLILDGNTGQNMLSQVQGFDEAAKLTGLVITKLDGTARGGAIAALALARKDNPIPVYFIGVGESIDDLQAFSAKEFAHAMLDMS